MKRNLIAIALAISVSGCGAFDEVNRGVDHAAVKKFEVKDVDTFQIADHPEEASMVISMSPSARAGAALNSIFTFGTTYPDASERFMKSAAAGYLQSTNRNCSIGSGRELARMQWEFRYQCGSAPTQH